MRPSRDRTILTKSSTGYSNPIKIQREAGDINQGVARFLQAANRFQIDPEFSASTYPALLNLTRASSSQEFCPFFEHAAQFRVLSQDVSVEERMNFFRAVSDSKRPSGYPQWKRQG